MCDPLPPKQILLIVSVHVNEILYRSQIFIEKSKTLNYFFNIYDPLVYRDPAALPMSALVLVSVPTYYTWSPTSIVCGRGMILPCRRSNWNDAAVPKEMACLVLLLTLELDLGRIQLQALTWNFLDVREFPSLCSCSRFPFLRNFLFSLFWW